MSELEKQKMKWNEMTGAERYQVVEMARRKELSVKDICETFGVSRQTLNKAIEKAEEAAKAALTPKKRGRKGKSATQKKVQDLTKQNALLAKQVEHWRKRYDVAQTFIDLQRETLTTSDQDAESSPRSPRPRQPKKKKRRSSAQTPSAADDDAGQAEGMDAGDAGTSAGHSSGEPEPVE
jgi:transposase-like protein